MSNRIWNQIRRALSKIARIFPKRMRKYIYGFIAIVGIYMFYQFMFFWTKSKYLVGMGTVIFSMTDWMISSITNSVFTLVMGITLLYFMFRSKLYSFIIGMSYLVVLVLGVLPFIEKMRW